MSAGTSRMGLLGGALAKLLGQRKPKVGEPGSSQMGPPAPGVGEEGSSLAGPPASSMNPLANPLKPNPNRPIWKPPPGGGGNVAPPVGSTAEQNQAASQAQNPAQQPANNPWDPAGGGEKPNLWKPGTPQWESIERANAARRRRGGR